MAKKTVLERLRDAKSDDERRRLIEQLKKQGTWRMTVPPSGRRYNVNDVDTEQ